MTVNSDKHMLKNESVWLVLCFRGHHVLQEIRASHQDGTPRPDSGASG